VAVQANNAAECQDLLDIDKYGELAAQSDTKGQDDWTALHLAAYEGFQEVCEVLLKSCEAGIAARTSMGRTALHHAAVRGFASIVSLLILAGADLNAEDADGNTPLHLASSSGQVSALQALLAHNPDCQVFNYLKKTPIDMAADPATSEVLESHCKAKGLALDSYMRTKFGRVLMRNSREDIVSRLLTSSKQGDPQALRIRYEGAGLTMSTRSNSPPDSPPHGSFSRTCSLEAPVNYKDFKLLNELGKGAFGEVYLVQKQDTGELFAMKVLRKSMLLSSNLMRYARTERNVLSYLKHPFIVGLKYAFQTNDRLAMLLDYCPGGDLRHTLFREKRLQEARARIYAAEILLALEELHNHNIIYRDLKPDNVVLDAQGHALLTDFGLSKEGISENMLARSFCGSVAYLAPEVLERKGHTKAVDLYLFGVLLYEMLSGAPPFYSPQPEELFSNILSKKLSFPRCISSPARKLISRLLERNPEKRPNTQEVKTYKFFRSVDWEASLRRELHPPLPPRPAEQRPATITMETLLGTEESQTASVPGWAFPELDIT
jgi:protein-serine/threonine kinase